jgi:hypothetical protein
MNMRRSLSSTVRLAITIVATVSGVAAAETSSCDLLTRDELAAAGFSVRGKPQLQTVTLRKGEHSAPTDIRSEVCFLSVEASGDRYGIYLSIDNFGEEISAAILDAWAKSLGESDTPGSESRIGNTTCETGSYEYTEAGEGKRIGTQRYVACDTIRGRRRVSLNLQAPEDKPALPTTETVKGLLDKAWLRL